MPSAGMVDLARSQYGEGHRSIGLWKDAITRSNKKIVLEPGAEAVLLNLTHEMRKEWTADGRNDHGKSGYLKLGGVYQVGRRRTAEESM